MHWSRRYARSAPAATHPPSASKVAWSSYSTEDCTRRRIPAAQWTRAAYEKQLAHLRQSTNFAHVTVTSGRDVDACMCVSPAPKKKSLNNFTAFWAFERLMERWDELWDAPVVKPAWRTVSDWLALPNFTAIVSLHDFALIDASAAPVRQGSRNRRPKAACTPSDPKQSAAPLLRRRRVRRCSPSSRAPIRSLCPRSTRGTPAGATPSSGLCQVGRGRRARHSSFGAATPLGTAQARRVGACCGWRHATLT